MTTPTRDDALDGAVLDAVPEIDAPRRRIAPIITVVAALVVAALVAVFIAQPPAGERNAASALVGGLAPPITGATFDGDTVDVDGYRGRWLVVNFFATWCVPCVEEHPELVRFHESHRARGDAALVSVVVDTPEREARAFFERHGGDWPIVLDPEGRTPLDYGMLKVPETFLVAPDGTVVQRLIGGVTAAGLDGIIDTISAAAEDDTGVAP